MEQALVPGLTLVISIGSIMLAQWRANKNEERLQSVDNRAAAKDTVAIMAQLNTSLLGDIEDLRKRILFIEQRRHDCEQELVDLTREYEAIKTRLELMESRGAE